MLPGQVQGVTAGSGVTINAAGQLSINANDPTFNGFVKTNNPTAYNAYVWPGIDGTAGQQLATDGAGNLSWSDASGIPWTILGQLVVGTGLGTSTILNPGSDTAALMADSSTASGLIYSNASTAAIQIPAGTTLQQPAAPVPGQLRYNVDNGEFEGYLGSPAAWAPIGGALPWTALGQLIVGTGVETDAILDVGADTAFLVADSTNAAYGLTYTDTLTTAVLLPAGDTSQRPAPVPGQIRFNSDLAEIEFYDGVAWVSVGSPIPAGLGIFLEPTPNESYKLKTPVQFGPPTAGVLPAEAIDGSLYWDNTLGLLFIRYNDGTTTQWVQVIPTGGGGGGGAGTVTSVGITGTQGIAVVSGSPVTSAGSITLGIDVLSLPPIP